MGEVLGFCSMSITLQVIIRFEITTTSDPIDTDSKQAEFADSRVEVADYTFVISGIIFLKEKAAPIVNNKYLRKTTIFYDHQSKSPSPAYKVSIV